MMNELVNLLNSGKDTCGLQATLVTGACPLCLSVRAWLKELLAAPNSTVQIKIPD